MKICTKCKQNRPFKAFNKWFYKNYKYQSWCKVCEAAYRKEHKDKRKEMAKQWAMNNPERYRAICNAKTNKFRYGITPIWLENALKKQNNKCKICKETCKLVVDHCHKTSKVRALLCKSCNFGLGNFKENTKVMTNAIKYLNKFCTQYQNSKKGT